MSYKNNRLPDSTGSPVMDELTKYSWCEVTPEEIRFGRSRYASGILYGPGSKIFLASVMMTIIIATIIVPQYILLILIFGLIALFPFLTGVIDRWIRLDHCFNSIGLNVKAGWTSSQKNHNENTISLDQIIGFTTLEQLPCRLGFEHSLFLLVRLKDGEYGVTLKAAFSEVRRDWLENLITELNGLLGRLQNREVERPEPVVNSGGKEDLEIYGKNILYSDKRRKIISDVYIVDPNVVYPTPDELPPNWKKSVDESGRTVFIQSSQICFWRWFTFLTTTTIFFAVSAIWPYGTDSSTNRIMPPIFWLFACGSFCCLTQTVAGRFSRIQWRFDTDHLTRIFIGCFGRRSQTQFPLSSVHYICIENRSESSLCRVYFEGEEERPVYVLLLAEMFVDLPKKKSLVVAFANELCRIRRENPTVKKNVSVQTENRFETIGTNQSMVAALIRRAFRWEDGLFIPFRFTGQLLTGSLVRYLDSAKECQRAQALTECRGFYFTDKKRFCQAYFLSFVTGTMSLMFLSTIFFGALGLYLHFVFELVQTAFVSLLPQYLILCGVLTGIPLVPALSIVLTRLLVFIFENTFNSKRINIPVQEHSTKSTQNEIPHGKKEENHDR